MTSGVKKSLVQEPGTSKISIRTSISFHPMSDGQVRKYSAGLYFHECTVLFGNRTSKNLGVLVRRTSEHVFTPRYIWLPNSDYRYIIVGFLCEGDLQSHEHKH